MVVSAGMALPGIATGNGPSQAMNKYCINTVERVVGRQTQEGGGVRDGGGLGVNCWPSQTFPHSGFDESQPRLHCFTSCDPPNAKRADRLGVEGSRTLTLIRAVLVAVGLVVAAAPRFGATQIKCYPVIKAPFSAARRPAPPCWSGCR